MPFQRMKIEDWFERYQYAEVNIGESGVNYETFNKLMVDLHDIKLSYGYHLGSPFLREQIAKKYIGLTEKNIGVTTGASEAIFCIIASMVNQDDQIIVEHPNYPSLYEVAKSLDRDLLLFPLQYEERFHPDFQKLESMITSKTKLIVLTHPNNPTGQVITQEELNFVIGLVEKFGIYLLMDETYRELSFEPPPPPASTLSPLAISITSMSKAFQVPGIRIGWVAAEADIINKVRIVREQITICNSAISERIALAILKNEKVRINEVQKLIIENLEILKNWMENQSELEWIPPKGGVVCFPRLINHIDSTALCELLVQKYNTFVVPGYCFEIPRHIRVGFGGDRNTLKIGLHNLETALHEFNNEKDHHI